MGTQDGGKSGDTDDRKPVGGSGDTDDANTTTNDDGDTSSNDDGKSGDTDELEQLRAKVAEQGETIQSLQKDKDDLTRDRDKGIRKRKSLEDRVGQLEQDRKADLEQIAAANRKERISSTSDAIVGELHPDHQASKTAKRVVKSLQGEGLDFAAEDRSPVVAKAVEILKRDNPEFFEKRKQERMPVLPKTKNGGVETEDKGGIRDNKGKRLI